MNSNEILNKYINLIDKGYCSDCNELNCIDNFPHAKIAHAIRELQQENKILRENAEHNDKVVDKVNWENQSLKKQLEEYKYSHSCSFVNICKNVKIANYNQQKEFIEYITSYIELLNNKPDLLEESQKDVLEEILSKYKSIIGVSDENK